MNLRAGQATPVQNLITLFKSRKENVENKHRLEKEVTEQNGRLVQSLQAIFKPIAEKTLIPFNITIRDEEIEVSTRFDLMRVNKKESQVGTFRLGIATHSINAWMESSENLRKLIYQIEKNVRLLARTTSKDRKSNKIVFPNPTTVTISIDTRNRFF